MSDSQQTTRLQTRSGSVDMCYLFATPQGSLAVLPQDVRDRNSSRARDKQHLDGPQVAEETGNLKQIFLLRFPSEQSSGLHSVK